MRLDLESEGGLAHGAFEARAQGAVPTLDRAGFAFGLAAQAVGRRAEASSSARHPSLRVARPQS